MKVCVLLVLYIGAVCAATINSELSQEWDTFKSTYRKTYSNPVEERFREKIFVENSMKIAKHHEQYLKGQSSYDMAMNEYGDKLHHEFLSGRNGWPSNYRQLLKNGTTFLIPENVKIPRSINWVTKGYVTAVQNQGECGSCYTFSATGALEGQHKRKTDKLINLSEQNILDCSRIFGNKGCSGGLPDFSFEYVEENKGIDTDVSYPYKAEQGECKFNSKTVGATSSGFVDLKSGSENHLMKAVGTIGPVSAGIDASLDSFQFYSKGVYDEPDCSSEKLTHAILVVGYGKSKEDEFWLVKNSWGTSWGEKGYVRMTRNKKNQCGIATRASYPLA